MKHLLWALPLAAVAIAGCSAVSQLVEDPGVSVTAHLDVAEPAGMHVLQVSGGAWTAADIQAARIRLYRVGTPDALLASQNLLGTNVTKTVTFTNLKRNTNYKITAEAWSDQAMTTQIDNFGTAPASCTTPFATTTVTPVQLGGITLTLRNTGFSGSTNGVGLNVVPGSVSDPTATESIIVN